MWTNEALELEMDVIEKRHVLKKVNESWNIFLSSLSNHLNDKTRSKNMGPKGVLIEKKECCNHYVNFSYARM
jgi:hypothetical protein